MVFETQVHEMPSLLKSQLVAKILFNVYVHD